MEFKDRIKKYRLENELTQEAFAKKLYVSRSSIAKWEQGRSIPSIELLSKIAELLNTTIDELINDQQLKLMTLRNSENIKRNNIFIKILILITFIAVATSIIIIVIILNANNKNETIYTPFYENVKVIQCDNTLVVKTTEDKQLIFAKNEVSNKDIYNRYEEKTTYDSLKVGYYLRLTYRNELLPNYNIQNLQKINIVEDYISDYVLYGFFVSSTEEDLVEAPVYEPSFGYSSYEEYIDINGKYFVSSFKYPYVLKNSNSFKITGFLDYTDVIIEDQMIDNQYTGMLSMTYNMQINFDRFWNSKIRIYALDNSERGFYLFKELECASTKVILSGYMLNGNQNSNYYKRAYSLKLNFDITINVAQPINKLTIYEYDKNNILLKEYTFTLFEDYYTSRLDMDEETLYAIVKKEVTVGNKVSTSILGINDRVEILLSSQYGYIYKVYYTLD